MFPDFEGTSGASSYDGKHAPGAAPSDWSYRIRRTISEHLREHSLGVLQKIEKGLWHSTRHTVKDQLRAARTALGGCELRPRLPDERVAGGGVESTVAGWTLLWRRHESQSR